MTKFAIRAGVSALALTLASPAAAVGYCTWNPSTSGTWGTTGSWSCGRAPTSTDEVTIGGHANNTTVTLTGTGNASKVTINSGDTLKIGNGSTAGTLTIWDQSIWLEGALNLSGANARLRAKDSSSFVNINGNGSVVMAGGLMDQGQYVLFANLVGYGTISGTQLINYKTITASSATALTLSSVSMYNEGTIQTGATNGNVQITGSLNNNGMIDALWAGSKVQISGANGLLTNLNSVGRLQGGTYRVSQDATMRLTSTNTNSSAAITTIGRADGSIGYDTQVYINGAGQLQNNAAGSNLEHTLTLVDRSGYLSLSNISTRSWNYVNKGMTVLSGGTMNLSGSNDYTGYLVGSGTLNLTNYTNNGQMSASSNTLTINRSGYNDSIYGTLRAQYGATLALTGTKDISIGFLDVYGSFNAGSGATNVSGSYYNANFGSGNSFNARANVTGTGAINALNSSDATMSYYGTGYSNTGGVGTMTLASRVGGALATRTLYVSNSGGTIVTGAIKGTTSDLLATGAGNFYVANSNDPGYWAISAPNVSTAVAGGTTVGTLTVANNFDNITDKQITVLAKVYQPAVVADLLPTTVSFAARQGDTAPSTTLTFANIASAADMAYVERLSVTSSAGSSLRYNGGPSMSLALQPGTQSVVTLSALTATAGAFNSTLTFNNTSLPTSGTGLTNLSLGTQQIAVTSKVYAAAVAQTASNTLDLGPVRAGGSASGTIAITNGAAGNLTDSLVTTLGNVSSGLTASGPRELAKGQSGNLTIGFDAGGPGQYSGSVALGFASHNPDMADLALAGKTIDITATVTELAKASLIDVNSTGLLTGGGNEYTINLGNVYKNAGTVMFSLGLKNDIGASSYAEKLGGSWTSLSGSNAYSFSAEAVGLIEAGASIEAGILSFMTGGQALGQYLASFEFNAKSHYDGLVDADQQAIRVNVIANLVAVPEPAVWLQMITGFGLVGGVIRKRRRTPSLAHA